MSSFYQMVDDESISDRWSLGEFFDANGVEIDCRDFTSGNRIRLGTTAQVSLRNEDRYVNAALPLGVEVIREGVALDVTLGAFETLVVLPEVAEVLSSVCGDAIQRVPARALEHGADIEVINCCLVVDCIDRDHSEIEWWSRRDLRPDKIGMPKMVSRLVVDSRANGSPVFRPYGWDLAVVVNEEVKNALCSIGVRGVRFVSCST